MRAGLLIFPPQPNHRQKFEARPLSSRGVKVRFRRVSLVRSVAAKVASRTDSNRSPFALTQFDDLKIGSDTGTCFKVGV